MTKNALIKYLIVIFLCLYFIIPDLVFGEPLTINLRIGDKQAIINNQIIFLDVAPLIKENRTFVPIRFISETFGAKVTWKEDSSENGEGIIKLLFNLSDKSTMQIKMHTNLRFVLIEYLNDGESIPEVITKELDIAPFMKKPENRTLVPLRFISELLNAKVTWLEQTKEITITKEKTNDKQFLNLYSKNTGNHPELEWEKKISGTSDQIGSFIQETVDGGFIISGTTTSTSTTSICVIKLSNIGDIVWQKYYQKNSINYGVSIFQSKDNGYLLFGNTLSSKNNKSNLYIVKLNWEGLVLWDKEIGDEMDERIHTVKPTKDEGFIICGQAESREYQNEDAFLLKMDGSGNIEWRRNFGSQNIDLAKDCLQTSDSGFVFIGSTLNQNGVLQIFLARTDNFGNLLWQKTFGKKGNFVGNSIVETPDKGFILLAETDSFSTYEGIYLVKVDTFGSVLWEKYYEGTKSTIGYSIEKTYSGYYMIAGGTNLSIDDFLGYNGTADGYFLFVDSYGNKVWDKILKGEKHDLLNQVIRTSDLGFIACGRSSSNDSERLSVYIVKLTPLLEEKPLLDVNPLLINFGLLEKNSSRITSFINISNNGAQNLTGYLQTESNWILLSDKSFIIPTFGNLKVLVSINPSALEEAAYDGQISITSNAGSQRVKVLCTIVDNSPRLFVDPLVIDFKTITERKKVSFTLSIYNMGRKNLYGSVQSNSPFIQVDPVNFVSNQQKVSITLLPTNLKNGSYKEQLKVQTNGGSQFVSAIFNVNFPVIKMILCINSPKAEIDDKPFFYDQNNLKIVPFILNGRTMVPVRFVSEAFGAEVFWDSFSKKIYLKIPSKEIQIVLQVNNYNALINQKTILLDVSPIIFEGRVYVPIRFIAEAFGAIVSIEKTQDLGSCIKILYEK